MADVNAPMHIDVSINETLLACDAETIEYSEIPVETVPTWLQSGYALLRAFTVEIFEHVADLGDVPTIDQVRVWVVARRWLLHVLNQEDLLYGGSAFERRIQKMQREASTESPMGLALKRNLQVLLTRQARDMRRPERREILIPNMAILEIHDVALLRRLTWALDNRLIPAEARPVELARALELVGYRIPGTDSFLRTYATVRQQHDVRHPVCRLAWRNLADVITAARANAEYEAHPIHHLAPFLVMRAPVDRTEDVSSSDDWFEAPVTMSEEESSENQDSAAWARYHHFQELREEARRQVACDEGADEDAVLDDPTDDDEDGRERGEVAYWNYADLAQ